MYVPSSSHPSDSCRQSYEDSFIDYFVQWIFYNGPGSGFGVGDTVVNGTLSLTLRNSPYAQEDRHVIKQLHYREREKGLDRARQGIHNMALNSDLEGQTRKASWRRQCLIRDWKVEHDLMGTDSRRRV